MADLGFIVGIIGNVISILVFTSPIVTFKRVVKKKSTENFKGVPYVTTLLSTSLWTYYGLLKPDGFLIVTVNGTGSVLQAFYVSLFIAYAAKDARVKMVKLVAILNVGFVGVVILVTLLAVHGSVRLLVIGVLCAALTLGMYAAPMAAMRTVVQTKSVEYMPFSLSFFLFLNGGVWGVYSVLVKDYFIMVPNTIGFALGAAQLVLYAVYNRKSPSAKESDLEKGEDEGSAHLVSRLELQETTGEAPTKHLGKGKSLPKTSLFRQNSLLKIVKSHSLNSSGVHSVLDQNDRTDDPRP